MANKIRKNIGACAAALSMMVSAFPMSTHAAPVQILSSSITELSSSGYRVNVTFSSELGVSRVQMPTWTKANGQDDLVWHEAVISGNTATFYVPTSAHKGESGEYITHIYVYDANGRYALKGENITVSSQAVSQTPAIADVSVTELSSSGYRVTAKISAPAGVKKVQMPTWTSANGQDDLVWHEATVSGDTATFYIPASAHKGESGAYLTHIYLYDNNGTLAPVKGVDVTVPANGSSGGSGNNGAFGGAVGTGPLSLSIPFITELTANGFRVTFSFNAPSGYARVATAVWTKANGQDDLVWHEMTVSGNMATCYIPVSSHNNEHGPYIVNAYVFESASKNVLQGLTVPVP